MSGGVFDAATAEETIAAFVSAGAPAEALLALLPEQHPLYRGRSANETTRIRGFLLAAFEQQGLPDEALPYVLEELESGHHPYLVAAAARALRGRRVDRTFEPLLEKARQNIRYRDAPLTFESYRPRWPVEHPTTALEEIRTTLDRAAGECCSLRFPPHRTVTHADLTIEFEDQNGRTGRLATFLQGKLSVVAFFYTRCDNPQKCSLTVAQLARLQSAVDAGSLRGQVRIAAITYDPQYDLPPRMKAFGEARGIRFADDVRFLRTLDLDRLCAAFDLGVNFIGSLVNRHRIELYVLDRRGRIVAPFTRMQWEVEVVLAELERLQRQPRWPAIPSSVGAVCLALLPKCPVCLGAYLSAAGLSGLPAWSDSRWTVPLMVSLLLVHLWSVSRGPKTRGATALSLVGAIALVTSMAWDLRVMSLVAGLLMVSGSVMQAVSADPRAPSGLVLFNSGPTWGLFGRS
jgi:protein SCO1